MKQPFIALIAAALLASPAFAQEIDTNEILTEDENTLVVNSFGKNWEVTLGLGTQAYLGEYSHTHLDFKDWWCFPGVDLSVQKWASPFFGFGLGANFSPYKGLYMKGRDTWNVYIKDDDPTYKDIFGLAHGYYINVFAKAYFSLTNIIGGYRPNRIYHLNGYLGGGVIFQVGDVSYHSTTATFNAGLINQFQVSPRITIDLAVRGALIGDNFNGISYFTSRDHDNIPMDGMIGITAGISYKFGFVNKKNKNGEDTQVEWVPMTNAVYTTKAYASAMKLAKEAQQKVKETEQKVVEQQAQIEEQKAEIAVAMAAAKVQKLVGYRQLVNFPIDKWTVSNREKVSIMLAAEVMKAAPDIKFRLEGSADEQTSEPNHNMFLARHRADVVREILVKEFGVNPDQLEIVYKGGVDYMFFEDPQCSRSVMITSLE